MRKRRRKERRGRRKTGRWKRGA